MRIRKPIGAISTETHMMRVTAEDKLISNRNAIIQQVADDEGLEGNLFDTFSKETFSIPEIIAYQQALFSSLDRLASNSCQSLLDISRKLEVIDKRAKYHFDDKEADLPLATLKVVIDYPDLPLSHRDFLADYYDLRMETIREEATSQQT